MAKGRDEEARALLVRYHAAGDENSALVEHEMIQIRAAVRDQYNQEKRPSLKKMVSSPANRMRLTISGMVAVSAQWSGNTVVSYYLTLVLDGVGIKNATHQSLINGGLQIFNLLATVGCGAMLVDVLGRRRLFQWSAIGMTVSYVVCKISRPHAVSFLLHWSDQLLLDLDYLEFSFRRHRFRQLWIRSHSHALYFLLPLRHCFDPSVIFISDRALPL